MSEKAALPGAMIELEAVHKWYGSFHVLKDINLEVRKGEKVVICGPSGSGKSTMIRCINRLEEHQKGRIAVSGIELTADLKNIEAIRRWPRKSSIVHLWRTRRSRSLRQRPAGGRRTRPIHHASTVAASLGCRFAG